MLLSPYLQVTSWTMPIFADRPWKTETTSFKRGSHESDLDSHLDSARANVVSKCCSLSQVGLLLCCEPNVAPLGWSFQTTNDPHRTLEGCAGQWPPFLIARYRFITSFFSPTVPLYFSSLRQYRGVSENSVPQKTQWFCWSLSLLNGYFIGNINPTFSGPNLQGPLQFLFLFG